MNHELEAILRDAPQIAAAGLRRGLISVVPAPDIAYSTLRDRIRRGKDTAAPRQKLRSGLSTSDPDYWKKYSRLRRARLRERQAQLATHNS